jgi:hypothetical protein
MSPANLQEGTAYYRLTFADANRTIPGVQPMIYVGANIFPDDDSTVQIYYFQDTISHLWRGAVTSATHDTKHPEIEAVVFPHTERELQSDILTLEEVIAALNDAHRRALGRH